VIRVLTFGRFADESFGGLERDVFDLAQRHRAPAEAAEALPAVSRPLLARCRRDHRGDAGAHQLIGAALSRARDREISRGAAGRLRGALEFARELRRKGIEYSLQRRTPNQAATKTGITSLAALLNLSFRPGELL
jgi:hypothetical protein